MIQRNKSRKDGFVFANGIIKTNKTIEEIKNLIYEAWDNAICEPEAIAKEIEITDRNSADFAKSDVFADVEIVHVPDDKEELYSSGEILMKYIEQNVNFVNTLEVVNVLNVSNKENLKKGKPVIELNVVIAKGEENYIYYELNLAKGDKNTVELAVEFACSLLG